MSERKYVKGDSARCIGCMTCMAACLRVHHESNPNIIPRLDLVTTPKVSSPVSCHHCEDAPCVKVCPTGCISDEVLQVGIKSNKCIGCMSCMHACPFGAIKIAERPKFARIEGDEFEIGKAQVALKCDLCANLAKSPTCVEVCLTKSLSLKECDTAIESLKRNQDGVEALYSELASATKPLVETE